MGRFFLVALLGFLVACGGGATKTDVKKPIFKMVEPPMTITDPALRLAWVANNYWNNVSFADTAFTNSDVMEQAYVDWINLLTNTSTDVARSAIGGAMNRSDSLVESRERFDKLSERYLYDPNSPMRNEDLYVLVLEQMILSPMRDSISKLRPRSHLEMAMRNRVGEVATDFSFEDFFGNKGSLRTIRSPYTLIFFNNPDCTACKDITEALSGSASVSSLLKSKKLTVLAMYTDKDIKAWRHYAQNIPSEWINAYNEDLHTSRQYDLKAIPTLYLLDKQKRVVLKDVDFRQLISFIDNFAHE